MLVPYSCSWSCTIDAQSCSWCSSSSGYHSRSSSAISSSVGVSSVRIFCRSTACIFCHYWRCWWFCQFQWSDEYGGLFPWLCNYLAREIHCLVYYLLLSYRLLLYLPSRMEPQWKVNLFIPIFPSIYTFFLTFPTPACLYLYLLPSQYL